MLNRRSRLSRAVPAALLVLVIVLGCAAVIQGHAASSLSTTPVGTFSQPADGTPTAVAVAGHRAYLTNACGQGCYGPLDVLDVSDPSRPTLIGTTPLSWGTGGIAVQGNYVYTTGYLANPNFLRVIDVSNPAQPFTKAAFTAAGFHPQAVAVHGSYAYMVDYGTDRLEVIDVSDLSAGAFSDQLNTSPTSLPLVGQTATDAGPSGIAVAGGVAYVVNAVSGTLQAISVADPAHPTVVGAVGLGNNGTRGATYPAIAVDGAYAYVADANADRLEVVDLHSPDHPSVVASVPTGHTPTAIALQGGRAFVANKGSDTLQVIDISSPLGPRSLGTIATGSGPTAVAVDETHVFVANSVGRSLQIFAMKDVGGGATPGGGAPSPPSPPASPMGSFTLPAADAFTVSRSGAVRFRVGCAGTGRCAGRAALTTATGRGRPASLGATRFRIAGGRSRTVTIHLNRAARQRVHRARHGLRARLALVGTIGGMRSSESKVIRLR